MVRVDLVLVGSTFDEFVSVWMDKSKSSVINMVTKDIKNAKIWKVTTPDKKAVVINMKFVKIFFVQDDECPEEQQKLIRE